MTEEQWLTSEDVFELRTFVLEHFGSRRKADRRKLRLLGCWGCRQLWDKMRDDRSRRAVEVAELLADGKASKAEVAAARAGAKLADSGGGPGVPNWLVYALCRAAEYVLSNRVDE